MCSNVDSHFNHHTAHRCTNLSWIRRISLGPGNILRCYDQWLLQFESYQHVCPQSGSIGPLRSSRRRLHVDQSFQIQVQQQVISQSVPENQDFSTKCLNLALLQFNVELLANLGFGQEIPRWKDTEITILLDNLAVFFIDFWILGITRHIRFVC